MKSSVTVTFVGLFLLVGAVFFYIRPFEDSAVNPSAEKKPASMSLMEGQEDNPITLIEIQNVEKNETLTIEKQGEKWMLTEPVLSQADALLTQGLVSALRLSNKARRLTPEKGWEEYGLAKPAVRIGVQTQGSKIRRYLLFGNPSPVGNFVYARWEGEKEYFLVQADLMKAFDRSLYSLRQKRVFQVPPRDISKITIKGGGESYEVAILRDKWYWMEPVALIGQNLTKEQMDEILNGVMSLNVKDFLPAGTNPKEKGFDATSFEIRIFGKGRTKEGLLIGSEVPEKDSFYAMKEGSTDIFYVARNNVRKFFQAMAAIALDAKAAGF